MKLVRAIVAVSAIAASAAFAGEKKEGKEHGTTPNCEVKGKKVHVKSKGACEKKKGTWLEAAAEGAAPAEAAPAAAPAAPAEAAPAK
jgi:hypothetical protein